MRIISTFSAILTINAQFALVAPPEIFFVFDHPIALDANTVLHGISQATVRATNSFGAAMSIEIMVPLSSFV